MSKVLCARLAFRRLITSPTNAIAQHIALEWCSGRKWGRTTCQEAQPADAVLCHMPRAQGEVQPGPSMRILRQLRPPRSMLVRSKAKQAGKSKCSSSSTHLAEEHSTVRRCQSYAGTVQSSFVSSRQGAVDNATHVLDHLCRASESKVGPPDTTYCLTLRPPEQFQENSQSAPAECKPQRQAYPTEAFQMIESARCILPSVERTELLIAFYMEQLDWMYNVADYDAIDGWLSSYLERIKQPGLYIDDLREGDATRLALVVACILASVQIASEGLVKVFYPDSEPLSTTVQLDPTRQSIKNSYETQLRNLLDVALQQDGSSPDLIRASLIYHFYLKNEGGHGQEGAVPLMQSISRLVKMIQLHLEPSYTMPEAESESRRRLFLSYYIFERITCITSNCPAAISDREITIKEPQEVYHSVMLGKRLYLCQIYKARLFKSIEGFVLEMKNGVTEGGMVRYEQFLQSWQQSLPDALDPSLPRLTPALRPVRGFDLERHLLQATFHISRSTVHRNCFFPGDGISMERVEASRQICIDSALSMIKIQESLRMRIVSDHHLRCLYVPLFTLEAALTLALASLIELASASPAAGVPASVQDYMRWAYRGRDLLVTIPTDFTQGVLAVKLVSRVLSKATQIIQLHALQIVPHLDDRSAIREILCNDEGERVTIPLLDAHFIRDDQATIHKRAYHNSIGQSSLVDARLPTTAESSSSTYPTPATMTSTPVTSNGAIAEGSGFAVSGSPTYADLGLEFFNELAAALQPAARPGPTTSFSSVASVPDHSSQTLDQQLDEWLRSLQNIA